MSQNFVKIELKLHQLLGATGAYKFLPSNNIWFPIQRKYGIADDTVHRENSVMKYVIAVTRFHKYKLTTAKHDLTFIYLNISGINAWQTNKKEIQFSTKHTLTSS